jgi:hypothetical protein
MAHGFLLRCDCVKDSFELMRIDGYLDYVSSPIATAAKAIHVPPL